MGTKKYVTLVSVHKKEMTPVIDSIYGYLLNDNLPKAARKQNVQRVVDKYELTQQELIELFIHHTVIDNDSIKSEFGLEKFVQNITDKLGVNFYSKHK